MQNTWILWLIALFFIVYLILTYNCLVRLRNEVRNAYGQIHVQLVRRYDLIPNLIEVAKKYMQHEQQTLTAVIQARQGAQEALQGGKIPQINEKNKELNAYLSGLFATVEAYPELKADRQMMALTEELSSTENRISFARQSYNDHVTDYSTVLQSFPIVLFASALGFKEEALLEFDSAALNPMRVKFD